MSWSQLDLSILITGGNLKPGNCLENPVSLNCFLSISELETTSLTGDLHDRGGPPSVSPCCASFQLHSHSHYSAAFANPFGYFPYFYWSFYTIPSLYEVVRHWLPLLLSYTKFFGSFSQLFFSSFQCRCKFCGDSWPYLLRNGSIIIMITKGKCAHTELSSPQYLTLILLLITLAGNMIMRLRMIWVQSKG